LLLVEAKQQLKLGWIGYWQTIPDADASILTGQNGQMLRAKSSEMKQKGRENENYIVILGVSDRRSCSSKKALPALAMTRTAVTVTHSLTTCSLSLQSVGRMKANRKKQIRLTCTARSYFLLG
jgi:hypothetical protein